MEKTKYSKENKKKDGDFKKKNINHNPQVESTKAAFDSQKDKHLD